MQTVGKITVNEATINNNVPAYFDRGRFMHMISTHEGQFYARRANRLKYKLDAKQGGPFGTLHDAMVWCDGDYAASGIGDGGGGGETGDPMIAPYLHRFAPPWVAPNSGIHTIDVFGTGFLSTAAIEDNQGHRTPATFISDTNVRFEFDSSGHSVNGYAQFRAKNANRTDVDYSNALGLWGKANYQVPPALNSSSSYDVWRVPGKTTYLSLAGVGFLPLIKDGDAWVSGSQLLISSGQSWEFLDQAPQNLNVQFLNDELPQPGNTIHFVVSNDNFATNDDGLTINIVAPISAPAVTSLNPSAVTIMEGSVTITATGTGFAFYSGAGYAVINGNEEEACYLTFVNSTTVRFDVNTDNLPEEDVSIVIYNSMWNGLPSNAMTLMVDPGAVGPLALVNLNPEYLDVKNGMVEIELYGDGFVPGMIVIYDGIQNIPTTYINHKHIQFLLDTDPLAGGTQHTVAVKDPSNNVSNQIIIYVNEVWPELFFTEPSSVNANSGIQTITLNGQGLVAGMSALIEGPSPIDPLPTTFISDQQLTFQLDTTGLAPEYYYVYAMVFPAGNQSNSVELVVS